MKVKDSSNRPGVVQRVPGGWSSQISMTFGTWRWWGFQSHAPVAFTPKEVFLILIFTRGPHYQTLFSKIPYRRILLQSLIEPQLVKKFLAFYRARTYVSVFTTACHWFPTLDRWIQIEPSHPTASRYILILYSKFDIQGTALLDAL